MDDPFWNHLTLFVAGMVTQYKDTQNFHENGIKHLAKQSINYSLPQQVRMPCLVLRLSQILRSADGGGQVNSKDASGLSGGLASSWAQDQIEIKFKGLESQPDVAHGQDATAVPPTQLLDNVALNTLVDATIRVKDKAKFALLKGRIDRDVLFNPKKGEFVFRIRQLVGQPILRTLAGHVKSINRLVGFLEAMTQARNFIKCERISLRQVVFTYRDVSVPGETDGAKTQKRWRVSLDLAKSAVRISLEQGNPHIRILDMLTKIVNTQDGLKALMVFMPLMLPVLRAADAIESKWETLESANQGRVEVFSRSIEWFSFRYTLNNSPDKPRIFAVDLKCKMRRNEAWWHISRATGDGNADADDEVSKILKGIWEGYGDGWRGLRNGAASRPGPSTMDLLARLDDAVRAHVATEGDGVSSTDGSRTQPSQTFSANQSFGTQPTSVSQGSNRNSQGSRLAPVVLD